MGTSYGTRDAACLSRSATGSGRPFGSSQAPWEDRGTADRADLPRATLSPTSRWSTTGRTTTSCAGWWDGWVAICLLSRRSLRPTITLFGRYHPDPGPAATRNPTLPVELSGALPNRADTR